MLDFEVFGLYLGIYSLHYFLNGFVIFIKSFLMLLYNFYERNFDSPLLPILF